MRVHSDEKLEELCTLLGLLQVLDESGHPVRCDFRWQFGWMSVSAGNEMDIKNCYLNAANVSL